MNSIIVAALSRITFAIMLAVSLIVLYRGHNDPGGGFVGGLVGASAFVVIALTEGFASARSALRLDPTVILGIGLLCTATSGLPGIMLGHSYLAHQWLRAGFIETGTVLLFDAGVYLVVLGAVLSIVVRFYERL